MKSNNNFTIVGSLGADAKVFNNEKTAKAVFSIAVNKGKDADRKTAWTDVSAWRAKDKTADFELLKKGKLLLLKGYFTVDEKTVNNEKKQVLALVAESWEPVERKKEEKEANE